MWICLNTSLGKSWLGEPLGRRLSPGRQTNAPHTQINTDLFVCLAPGRRIGELFANIVNSGVCKQLGVLPGRRPAKQTNNVCVRICLSVIICFFGWLGAGWLIAWRRVAGHPKQTNQNIQCLFVLFVALHCIFVCARRNRLATQCRPKKPSPQTNKAVK